MSRYFYGVVTDRQEGGHLWQSFNTFNKALDFAISNNHKEIEVRIKGSIGYSVIGILKLK